MKTIAVLGSTGSIGSQTLNIIRRYPDKFRADALVCGSDCLTLARQAQEFKPSLVGIADESAYKELKPLLPPGTKIVCGGAALTAAASAPDIDVAVAAVSGMAGLSGVMAAIERGKTVALANKESLVAAGKLVTDAAAKKGARILPVDSEHSAVWQCLQGGVNGAKNLSRIILTASGGAFYGKSRKELKAVTPDMATKHPNWSMGKKITVDSATMMNKGLEIIEAARLFCTDKIDYVIHPQSIIHSMVEFNDGSLLAQMSGSNMEYPIALALSYPERLENPLPKFDFTTGLTFLPPDEVTFPLPALARAALKADGTAPCVLNAANEAAVKLFLDGKIGFLDIEAVVRGVTETAEILQNPTLNDIFATHAYWIERLARDYKNFLERTF
ncbi:MAG: 1-deoxy-D-xylulose-5-phosphate reductoisomerase [Clostridiales bacterium]|jgi:1-deoxy-D-xylulose-5-phosphate reductoisomerase|nr:1-deoxy-D-xylulose-5-phosphate reductoisomerase [Clostridiales bacterium]